MIRNNSKNSLELGCTTLDSTWSNVVSEPALPVVHDTSLKLNCQTGYINIGGNTAKCLYGQVDMSSGPPHCKRTGK